jgi:hypothetical protein
MTILATYLIAEGYFCNTTDADRVRATIKGLRNKQ